MYQLPRFTSGFRLEKYQIVISSYAFLYFFSLFYEIGNVEGMEDDF
jgi:hypothetical protein